MSQICPHPQSLIQITPSFNSPSIQDVTFFPQMGHEEYISLGITEEVTGWHKP